ncbi:MAG: hypothetical protein SFZ02_20470 [bacterium]|nr:hypothetical protein [bacterium]
MKLVKFFILLVILALPLSLVSAQDEGEDITWSGSYVVTAGSGSFVEADDDVFTLTLNDVSEYTTWVVNLPDLTSGILTTQDLIAFWTFQPELTATAVLTTENESVLVTLALAEETAFDPEEGTLTFTAVVTSTNAFDPEIDDAKADLPEEFELVTVFINMDATFVEGITAGMVARNEGTRANTSQTCTPTPANNFCK